MAATTGFSRFTLGGAGTGVNHKLGFDVGGKACKWTLLFDGRDGVDPTVLRSSGAAVKVSGRLRHIKSNKERSFVVSMDDAKKLSLDVTDLSTDRSSVSDLFDQTSPQGFWRILITASGFAEMGVPQIGSICIEAICADKPTKTDCNIPESAVLMRGSIFFAPSADREEELLIDHITLIDADLYIPEEPASVTSLKAGPAVDAASSSSAPASTPTQVPSTRPSNGGGGSPSRTGRVNLGHTRIDENSNILPVGSHRQRSNYFSWLFSSRTIMTLFFAFVAWALTYSATISRADALYSSLCIIATYLIYTVLRALASYFGRSSPVNCRSMFINSYNAWGYCGTVRQGERLPMYAMPHALVRAFHDGSPALDINLGTHRKSTHVTLASDMFSVLADRSSRVGLVVGFLSQREQFGCVATNDTYDHLSVRCTCDGVTVRPSTSPTPMVTDWLFLQAARNIDEEEPLAAYMVTSGRYNSARVKQFLVGAMKMRDTPPSGWCSWYHFFSNIREENLVNNAEAMVSIKAKHGLNSPRHGFDLFQIDDGYQRAWGDWLTLDRSKFPKLSLATIVGMVRSKGMLPGLWIAPFAADKHSTVVKEHPSWILRKGGPSGKPANSANCGKWFYGLDVTNPEVQAHVRTCISTMTAEWGVQYLKLDFLYVAALADAQRSYFDRTLTRAQAMQVAMQAVTQSAGPYVYLLGCGAPMGSVIGHVHANRVSCDAGLSWFPEFPLPSYDKWNLPSARSMIRNTICRMSMHARWWINDPDCMLLRRSTTFTDEEIIGIATVKAMCGGSFILSDDLAVVSEDRVRIAQQLLPATNLSAQAVDLLDSETPELLRLRLGLADGSDVLGSGPVEVVKSMGAWTVLAVCNWGEEAKSHKVSLSSCLGSDSFADILALAESGAAEGPVLVHIFDFWTLEYSNVVLGDSGGLADNAAQAVLHFPPVAAHSARILALRVQDYHLQSLPMYIGSNLHFSCGLEVASFTVVSFLPPANAATADNGSSSAFDKSATHDDDNQMMVTRSWSCKVVFEEGAVRDRAWGGFVWLFLPVEASHPLTLTGSAVSGVRAKGARSAIASLVVPLSGKRGTVFKFAVGRDFATDPVLEAGSSASTLVISWTDSSSREALEEESSRRGNVVFRS